MSLIGLIGFYKTEGFGATAKQIEARGQVADADFPVSGDNCFHQHTEGIVEPDLGFGFETLKVDGVFGGVGINTNGGRTVLVHGIDLEVGRQVLVGIDGDFAGIVSVAVVPTVENVAPVGEGLEGNLRAHSVSAPTGDHALTWIVGNGGDSVVGDRRLAEPGLIGARSSSAHRKTVVDVG